MYRLQEIRVAKVHARRLHGRELRFLALVLITGGAIVLQLGEGLRLAGLEGSGWRAVDLPALERRIESGALSDHEAVWYHETTKRETRATGAPGQP
jgi:hypothetical protein